MDWMKTVLDQKEPDLPVVNVAPLTASAKPVTAPRVAENSAPVTAAPVTTTVKSEPAKPKQENINTAKKADKPERKKSNERKKEQKKTVEVPKPKEPQQPKYIYQGG